MMEQPVVIAAGKLKGVTVRNRQGENLGHLEEIMIDVTSGRIAYAVLAFGGFLGFGDKLFAVPWASLLFDPENQQFLMDASKELLERAPGFDKNHWPETPNAQWYHDVYEFYGHEWSKS
jgi:sporulation protein YlmC with PRC-barrel domain